MNKEANFRKNTALLVLRSFEELSTQAQSICEYMAIELDLVKYIEPIEPPSDEALKLAFDGFELALRFALESRNVYCRAANLNVQHIELREGGEAGEVL